MSTEPIWVTADGKTMARCPDCNKVSQLRLGDEHVIEVGAKGQPVGVICQDCWRIHERCRADAT
jgi:hypothetical protein